MWNRTESRLAESHSHAQPDPSPSRRAWTRQPGLVGVAKRRAVLVCEDRRAQRLEQRSEAVHAVGQRARRDRQPLVGQPRRDPVQRAQAHVALEQEARPDARSVRRAGEQSGHGGRRRLGRRRRAPAGPPPAPAADHPPVRPDLDLDKRGLLRTVGRVRAPAAPAHPRIRRRVVFLGAFLKPRPLGATMARRPGLLAPPPFRARPLPPFARAAGPPLRQHRPRLAKLGQPALQALAPPLQRPHLPAEPGLVPPQLSDRRLPAPRSAQRLAQRRVRLAAGPAKAPHFGPAGIERLPQRPALPAQTLHLHPQRHHRVALPRVHPGLPQQTAQTLHLALQRQGVPRRPAGLPRRRDHPPQPPPRRLPPRLPIPRVAARPHLRPPQLLGARLRRLRPLTLTPAQRPPVHTLRRRPGTGHRPHHSRPLDRSHAPLSVRAPYRHATDDNTYRNRVTSPPRRFGHDARHGSTERLHTWFL